MAAGAATCLVSIFAAQVTLSVLIVVYLARLAKGETRLARLPLDGPILAFSVWTLLSASFSPNPVISYETSKKLVLFCLLPLAVDSFARERDREAGLDAVLLGGLVLATGTLLQFYFLGFDTVNHRPTSFMGHYMTASGLVMSVLLVALARLLFRGAWVLPTREDGIALGVLALAFGVLTLLQRLALFGVWPERFFVLFLALAALGIASSRGRWPGPATGTLLAALVVPASIWALVVSRTRNAWLGALVGLAVLAVLKAPRTLWVLAAGLGALVLLRPTTIIDRLTVTDASSVDRFYMWQAGVEMIRDRPLFGQGPGMILPRYPSYRWPQAPSAIVPHLHDNALQIAAERGLPCLAFWLWWVAAAMADAYRETGARWGGGWVAAASLALLVALMVAGLFEYNFGDSEVLMFALVVSALPYALRRERGALAA